jgi:ADP-ribose pyrophosphatase
VTTWATEHDLVDESVDRAVLHSERRFDGRVLGVRTDRVDLGDGQQVERDIVVHPGAVGVVAVDDDLRLLMVRQYRHPVRAMLWEAPAGLLDVEGEDPADAAARELFEEGGYRARDWSVLVDAFATPGGSDEAVRIYLARDLTEVPADERHVGEDEERGMQTRWVPLEAARQAVLAGQLHNALAVMGILAAAAVLLDDAAPARDIGEPWFRQRGSTRS